MIKNNFKMYDSKTEFIVFRSPQAKQDLGSLSVYVGDSIIQQSSKVRDLDYALISTRIDYCNSVLYNLPRSSISRL